MVYDGHYGKVDGSVWDVVYIAEAAGDGAGGDSDGVEGGDYVDYDDVVCSE